MDLTQDDNLLIQSYLTTAFLTELKTIKFLESEYYKKAEFQDAFVKENISKVRLDNQGALLMFLYSLLVIPREILEKKYPDEFEKLNIKVEEIKINSDSSYRQDLDKINYVRHIRNAVAHARVSFVPEKSVTFTDENSRGEICTIEIPLNRLGVFLTELQKIFMKYIEKLKNDTEPFG